MVRGDHSAEERERSLLLTATGSCDHHKSVQMCSSALSAGSASFWDLVRPSCQSSTHAVFWFLYPSWLWRLKDLLVFYLFVVWQRELVYQSVVA